MPFRIPPPPACPTRKALMRKEGAVRGEWSPCLSSHLLIPHSSQPEFVNVCFWFVPPSLRGKKGSPDYNERLAKVGSLFPALMNWLGTDAAGAFPPPAGCE